MLCFLQTAESGEVTAQDALKKGFQDLRAICDVTKRKFAQATEDYYSEHPDQRPQTA